MAARRRVAARPTVEAMESRQMLSSGLEGPALAGVPPASTFGANDPIQLNAGSILTSARFPNIDIQVGAFVQGGPAEPRQPPDHYLAFIDWGDNTVITEGRVDAAPGNVSGLRVFGSHSYMSPGTYNFRVYVVNRFTNVNVERTGTVTVGPAQGIYAVATARLNSDFDVDGISDRAVFEPGSGSWISKNSADRGVTSMVFGAPNFYDIPIPADYDGDGRTDFAVFRPNPPNPELGAEWIIFQSNTRTFRIQRYGAPNLFDIPIPADYDGDGRADLAVFRPNPAQQPELGAEWIIFQSSTSQFRIQRYGAPNLFDIPAPADFDGDGRADLVVFRPSPPTPELGAEWIIFQSSTSQFRIQRYGAPNLFDVPVPGDFDGDGRADLGVYRRTTAEWIHYLSRTNEFRIAPWGVQSLNHVPVTTSIGSLVRLGYFGPGPGTRGFASPPAPVVGPGSPSASPAIGPDPASMTVAAPVGPALAAAPAAASRAADAAPATPGAAPAPLASSASARRERPGEALRQQFEARREERAQAVQRARDAALARRFGPINARFRPATLDAAPPRRPFAG